MAAIVRFRHGAFHRGVIPDLIFTFFFVSCFISKICVQVIIPKDGVDQLHQGGRSAVGFIQTILAHIDFINGRDQIFEFDQELALAATPAEDGLLLVSHHDEPAKILSSFTGAHFFDDGFKDLKLHERGILKFVDQDEAAAMREEVVKLVGLIGFIHAESGRITLKERLKCKPGDVVISHILVAIDELVILVEYGGPDLQNLSLLGQEVAVVEVIRELGPELFLQRGELIVMLILAVDPAAVIELQVFDVIKEDHGLSGV